MKNFNENTRVFDLKEEKYVLLADEFRAYFREKGFVPKSTQDAKESIGYMEQVMKKIREINRRNNLLFLILIFHPMRMLSNGMY